MYCYIMHFSIELKLEMNGRTLMYNSDPTKRSRSPANPKLLVRFTSALVDVLSYYSGGRGRAVYS